MSYIRDLFLSTFRPTGKYLVDPKSQVVVSAPKFDANDPKTWPKKAGNYLTNKPGLWPWPIAAEPHHAEFWSKIGITDYALQDDLTKSLMQR